MPKVANPIVRVIKGCAFTLAAMCTISAAGAQAAENADYQAQQMYHFAWEQLRDGYVDGSFNGQKWASWEHKFDAQLHSTPEAIAAIKLMTASLADPYTRVAVIAQTSFGEVSAATKERQHPVTWCKLDNGTGYIKLSTFASEKCIDQFSDALHNLQSADSLVLDLRGNRGGSVTNALEIADMFLESGDIMTSVSRAERKTYTASDMAVTNQPVVILVDHSSASATEIFTAALHDNHRATVIGATTFGKGLIQDTIVLPGDSAVLFVTTAHYLTPSGSDINKVGITPDVNEPNEQRELKAAVEVLHHKT